MSWIPFPLLRVAITLSAGIFVQEYCSISPSLTIIGIALFVVFWLLAERFWSHSVSKSTVTGFALLSTVFFIGIALVDARYARLNNERFATEQPVVLTGTLTERLKSENKHRFVFKTDFLKVDTGFINHNANIIITFGADDSLASQYHTGQHLYLRVKLKQTVATTNPEAFDYTDYLKYKSIAYLGFVPNGDHFLLAKQGFNFFRDLANSSTLFSSEVIHKYITDSEAVSIAEALLIGQQLNISDEIYKSYADTGAIHVLSVSGMHVAIFIAVFLYLFNQVKRQDLGWKLFKVSSILLIVWFYVILTGMTPSVVRAGAMVSLYVLGNTFFKGYNTYNMLALAAILMLFYDPFYLFQISFQLSFISLLSILFFQPKIDKWWTPKNKFLKFCWSLVNVSLAAQVLIFPISVFIFHQFSLSFALSSLLAVPLVSVIIYGGTLMILAALVWDHLALVIGIFIEKAIIFLNYIILKISELPYSVMTDVYLSKLGFVLLALAVLSLMYWTVTREKSAFYIMLSCVFLTVSEGSMDKIMKKSQSFMVIYDMYGNDVIDFGNGHDVARYVSGDLADERIIKLTRNFLVSRRISHVAHYKEPLYVHDSMLVFVYKSEEDLLRLQHDIAPKYLYIAGDTHDADQVLERLQPDTVILSPNLKPWIAKKWVDLHPNYGYVVHDIKSKGSFLKVFQ